MKPKAGEEITLATVCPAEIPSQQIHSSITQTSSSEIPATNTFIIKI